MSNNNPHNHINQTAQNSSWNPLQIPSYIPRQPQLAHMSNERPMVRSPLAWHAAAPPPESLYNFMSAANHKNLEHSMNPLLPPYVRGPPPFDSMDLSLQSNRSANSPLNKTAHSLLQAPPSQFDYGLKQAQQQHNLHQQQAQQQMHAQNSYPIHNLSTNAAQHNATAGMPNVSNASATSTQSSPAHNTGKFLSSNGNDCEQPASLIQASNLGSNNGNNYLRDVVGGAGGGQRHNVESYGKMSHINRSYENESHSKSLQKPVELVNKDCSYPAMLPNKLPTTHIAQQSTTKKHSPLRGGNIGYHQQQQQSPFNSPAPAVKHNGPHTPPTPQSPSGIHQTQSTTSTTQQQQLQSHQSHSTLLHSGGGGGNNNANALDYNQLHLQQPHNSYTQSPQHLSQQQQQHMHHTYPPTSTPQHLQHWPPQQTSSNVGSLASQSTTTQSHMQSTHLNSPLHQQQQQSQSQNTPLTNQQQQQHQTPQSPASTTFPINNETNFDQQQQQTNISSLPVGNTSPRRDRLPDTADSPETNASSNDEESGDDSCSMVNKQKNKKSINHSSPSSNKDYESSNVNLIEQKDNQQIAILSNEQAKMKSINKSPKSSPTTHQRKSPRRVELNSPESLDLSSQRSTVSKSTTKFSTNNSSTPLNKTNITQQQQTVASSFIGNVETETSSSGDRKPLDLLKNGRTPPQHLDSAENEVETIDKIAEMIAKTTSNSSHSSNSNDAHSQSSSKSAPRTESPKTKKQRQALKLRNAEHNSEWTATNSYNDSNKATSATAATTTIATATGTTTPTIINPLSNNDDNAVLAEELRKEAIPPSPSLPMPISPRKQPLSPHSNSHSSSSSSSSSSCSNSSRSSCGSRKTKQTPTTVDGKENLREIEAANVSNKSDGGECLPTEMPLNLNCKAVSTPNNNNNNSNSAQLALPATSPDKSSFEEVENKLEEMFAGIDDEPLLPDDKQIADTAQTPPASSCDVAAMATDLSVALELSHSLSGGATTTSSTTIEATKTASAPPPPPPIQTKAAKKSTVPSPIKPATPPPSLLSLPPQSPPSNSPEVIKESSNSFNSTVNVAIPPTIATPTRKTMPRRRLSMALDPGNLRILLESNNEQQQRKGKTEDNSKEIIVQLDAQLPSTSAAASTSAATSAAAGNDDSNKQQNSKDKNRLNKNKNAPATNANTKSRSTGNGTNPSSGGIPSNKPTSKTSTSTKKSKQKQSQQKRRKQSSSEEDLSAAVARDATASGSNNGGEKYKSPFILVKRDGSVSVINTATAEDNNTDKQVKAKKVNTSYPHHERRRIRGLHSSTLSQKYDADTTDSTWICVFCKRGPHRMGLGDLFGPYLVTIDCEEYKNAVNAPDALDVDEEFISKRRRLDMVQCNARGPPVVLATKVQDALAAVNRTNKKKKKSNDDIILPIQSTSQDPLDIANETFLGMSKVSENGYEVWLHEDCSIWAPDVFLVGARIVGLDAAVWNSTRYQCVLCTKQGATVCCLQRDCKAAAHVPCAREACWNLNERTWHVHCQVHVRPSSSCSSTKVITTTAITTTTKATTEKSLQSLTQNLSAINS